MRPGLRTRPRRAGPGPAPTLLGLAPALALALASGACGGGEPAGSTGAAASGEPEAPDADRRRTRVVLITLDTLRLDAFSTPAAAAQQMPRTVEWALRGAVFQRYYSVSSTTLPAHASMMSGLHPWEHGATSNGLVFPERFSTVAELLRERGFATGAVVASFPLHERFGLAQGFDRYHNEFGQPGQDFEGLDVESIEREGDLHSIADRINERAFELLDELGDGDQFAWIHYFDPHAPYGDSVQPDSNWFPRVISQYIEANPAETDTLLAQGRDQYRLDVEYLDQRLAELFERLARDEDRYETHVVLVSDHGEAFGEGGTLGHGKRLVLVQVHVPLVIVSPSVQPGFRQQVASAVDLAPTLLSLAGVRGVSAGGGLDLTAPGHQPTREVYGMRRTFGEPTSEVRVDGSEHELETYLFFAAGTDSFLVGNADEVTVGDTDKQLRSQKRTSHYQELFAGFQRTLAELPEVELDEASLRALEKLGYTR